MKSKRGMELTFNTIVYMVIAIFLLVLVLAFVTNGFSGLKTKISSYFTNSNVDSIVDNCNNLVMQDAKYEYCCANKTVIISSKQKYDLTCLQITNRSFGSEITKIECGSIC